MYIIKELDLNTFEAWSGAVNTLDRIRANNLCDQLEAQLEELYPDGMTETELNDLLWFDDEMIYEMLGLKTAEELSEEIDEISTRIDDLIEDKLSLLKDAAAGEDVKDDIYEIDAELEELQKELNELHEEYDSF